MAEDQEVVVEEILAKEALRVTEQRGPEPPGDSPARVLHREVSRIDAELQNLGDPKALQDEPDPRLLIPTIRDAIEDYSELRFGAGIYKITFTLDPCWTAKVAVVAYGDIKTVMDLSDPDAGDAALEPETLGSFTITGDPAPSVGFAVHNLKVRVQEVLRADLTARQDGIDALMETLAFMEGAASKSSLEGMWPKADPEEGEERQPPQPDA